MIGLRILLVALVQAGLLGGVIYDRFNLIATGREVVLDVQPIDPRDFFRGDYVVLTYAVSQIDARPGLTLPDLTPGSSVFVTLRQAGEAFEVAAIAAEAPPPSEAVVLRGQVSNLRTRDGWTDSTSPPPVERLWVRYGIESYFVPQGHGRTIETLRNDGRVQIVAAVGQDGRAAIKALLIDGVRVYEEGLF